MESGYQVLNMVAQQGFDPNLFEKQKIALAIQQQQLAQQLSVLDQQLAATLDQQQKIALNQQKEQIVA